MIITLTLVSLILLGTTSYFGYRAYVLAGLLAESEEYTESLDLYNIAMYSAITDAYNKMIEIDHKGAFESDDEAGTTFSLLKDVIINLNTEFNGTQANEEI